MEQSKAISSVDWMAVQRVVVIAVDLVSIQVDNLVELTDFVTAWRSAEGMVPLMALLLVEMTVELKKMKWVDKKNI